MIKEGFWNFFTEIFSMLLVVIVVGVLSIVIKGFITWYDELKLKDELTLRNHKIELALVKSQLDPHFYSILLIMLMCLFLKMLKWLLSI